MPRSHTAPERTDLFRLDGGGRFAARSLEIAHASGCPARRVLQGLTERGRGVVVLLRMDARGNAVPIVCRPMDRDEAASYRAWCGCEPVSVVDGSRSQWAIDGVAPVFTDDHAEVSFWLDWSFAHAFDRAGDARVSSPREAA